MSNSDVSDVFYDHVFNYMPAHLLHINDSHIRLIHRDDLHHVFNPQHTTDEEIASFISESPNHSRAEAIRDLVSQKLRYAIFSHRWLLEGEPTIDTVAKHGVEGDSLGLQKLQKFCDTAKELGCNLAWCDTCCIDKTSSAELDEAIRSMFKWYRYSAVCIVLLAKTTGMTDIQGDPWFRRGWTLQELLAPARIKFYCKDWSPLSEGHNDKYHSGIMDIVSQITRIDQHNLRYFSPGLLNVREKMLWASSRKTTRAEDVAYSLLGIFNISMPIAYGEGKHAFRRLMEGIASECHEWQIFAWAGPRSPYAAAFPESPAGYHALTNTAADLLINPQIEHRPWGLGYPFYAMTKKGLELGVLMVEMMLHIRRVPDEGSAFERLTFSPGSDSKRYFEDTEAVCDTQFLHFSRWAVGIINYQTDGIGERDGMAELDPGKEYICFLFGTGIYSPYRKWEKVETKEIMSIRTTEVVRKPITTVWL